MSVRRRELLRGAGLLGVGALSAAAVSACTGSPDASPVPATDSARPTPSASAARPALVYFSRPGENYWHGGRRDLEVGNTQVVAERIARLLVSAEVIRLEAADPYPHGYDETVDRNRSEQQADARPEIAGGVPDLGGYRRIVLGCPVWNTRAPMIIRTLLDSTDLTGKTIHRFLTYAVGQGRVVRDYADLYPGATIARGLAIQGERASDAGREIEEWLADGGLVGR